MIGWRLTTKHEQGMRIQLHLLFRTLYFPMNDRMSNIFAMVQGQSAMRKLAKFDSRNPFCLL